ncbi:MAG: hypothetical protein WDW38_000605 [Sanguina aurantia]
MAGIHATYAAPGNTATSSPAVTRHPPGPDNQKPNGRSPHAAPTGGKPGAVASGERIYSISQMVEALGSATGHVRDQLNVLAILDGTALSWPGVVHALDDLECVVAMAGAAGVKQEKRGAGLEVEVGGLSQEVHALRETLAGATRSRDDSQRELKRSREEGKRDLDAARKEVASLQASLDASGRELNTERQAVWGLEKVRADLAAELEKSRMDTDFMEGEIGTLRAGYSEQSAAITTLREELSGKRSDVVHLGKQAADHKATGEVLKKQLDFAQANLREVQVLQLQGQIRDLQRHVVQSQTDKAAAVKSAEEARGVAAAATHDLNATWLRMSGEERDQAIESAAAKEATAVDLARMRAMVDGAVREMTLQRALAEGWSRDVKSTAARLAMESERTAQLQAQLDAIRKDAAANLKSVCAALEAKESDLKKAKYDSTSQAKLMQKQVERLQRENDASAAEIERLRGERVSGGAGALPRMNTRIPHNQSLQDDLAALKSLLQRKSELAPSILLSAAPSPTSSLPSLTGNTNTQSLRHQPGLRFVESNRQQLSLLVNGPQPSDA